MQNCKLQLVSLLSHTNGSPFVDNLTRFNLSKVGPVLVTIQPSNRPVLHVGIQQLVFQGAQKHVGLLGHEKDLR